MAIFDSNHSLASILFVGYLIALSWLVTRLRFFQSAGLSRHQLIMIYLLKVAAGIFYGWVGIHYATTAKMTDTWLYHAYSIEEERLLWTNPTRFFSELVVDPYEGGRWKFFATESSYWNDLKANALIKGLAILSLLTGGHYLVNVLFYNFMSMIGVICYFKLLTHRFNLSHPAARIAAIFIPSTLYWTSGIHKEGILFTAIGCAIYAVYFSYQYKKWNAKRTVLLLLSILAILVFRNHLLIALIPALLLWALLEKFPLYKRWITLGTYAIFVTLFFASPLIHPQLNLPGAVVRKQNEFLQLKGKNSLASDRLEPTPEGFLRNLPQSVDMALTRPHLSNARHLLSLAAFVEVLLWGLILTLWILFPDRNNRWLSQPIDYFLLTFSVSVILIIGFSINNIGAIVRYRSIVVLPLLAPFILGINWRKVLGLSLFKF